MAESMDDARIGAVIAGYRIEERIGRGGMGVVYRAEHLNLRRRAAVKIIAPDLADSTGFRDRFTREARIAAALEHPNIVTVYDAGEVDGLLYLAMQFIEGSDLAGMLRTEGRLRPYRAVDVCRQVASALDAAHAMGLIHRDVKPANVLIEGRTAFLTDFGLTKRIDGSHTPLTRAGDVVGTIHYVAPEQIEGSPVTARTDVYSLGCLLYHCLAGQVPFTRDTDVAVIYAHLSEAPPKITKVRPELPDGLDAVIAKALDKSPDRRFSSCGDMISAARAVIDAAGPLADTSAPRASTTSAPMGGAVAEMRDAAAAARRPRVLLAGLDPGTRAVARVALGQRVDVLEAAGEHVLERAREERPDLVLLPWRVAGGELVGALGEDALTRDAKILLLVDDANARSRDVAAAGADDRLAAPFSPLQLQVKLRKLLGSDVIGG
jgi:tRNA A-37 threonylcarbamoyl transferase component Bud32/CheY-like chemotaxis protein